MDNEIDKFVNEDLGEIRTVTINNEPWFGKIFIGHVIHIYMAN